MLELKPEEALHFQSEWCRINLASIGDAVITTDTEGRVTFLNSVAESLTGWTRDEAAGVSLASVFKIVNQETRKTVETPTVRALRGGVVAGLGNHTLLIAKNGIERSIDDRATTIRNDQGEAAGVVLVFRDITQRHRQEQALQDAFAFADNLIAALREPFLVLEKNLRVVAANRSFYQYFHVTREETQGRFVYDLGNRQWDTPQLRKLLEEVLPQNHAFQVLAVEHEFPTIGRKMMLLNARRIPKPGNQSELILLAIEDITERSQAEAAVLNSEVRYRRLFETAKDGILILDTHTGRITDANPFMSELLGYSHGDFLDKELWQIGLFGDKSANEAAFRELREKGYIRYDNLPLESDRGRRVEVEVVANVYHEDHQSVIQCNIRDITERSRLERKTHEQAEALADLYRRKDEFLAMLSHELRNPLAPISSAVQLLRLQKNEDQIQQQALTVIERQVGQLTHLVDDLLEVSRIITGRIHLQQERITLNGIVENGVETVRTLIEQRRHVLKLSLPPQPIWLFADASRLEQVVVNLLTNAAKYTADGGLISLSVQREGDDAVLRVRDTGVGIAPELLPRIFDLFTQAERSLDRSQGGLGIGLCLVQRLVEMHRGRVDVYSTLGQGTEFVMRLPVMATPASQPPSTISKTTSTEATKPNGPSLRVLVVDDSVDAAQGIAMLLKVTGHDVRTAYDGPTALEAALDFHPNVVLLDIGLPGLDGFEVAKRLRQQPLLCSAVLVALTGYGQNSDRQRSQEAGFDHYLVKPANFSKLQQILATVSEYAI
jgi:PAS domain S-box-containing protein